MSPCLPAFLHKHFPLQSSPSGLLRPLQSIADFVLGLLFNLFSQLLAPMLSRGLASPAQGTYGCPEDWLRDSHSIQTVTDQLLHSQKPQMLHFHPKQLPRCGDLTPASVPPLLRVRSSPVSLSSFSPYFLHPTEFYVVLYIIYFLVVRCSCLLSDMLFCRIFCVWRCILMYPWRGNILHTHLLPSVILYLLMTSFLKD